MPKEDINFIEKLHTIINSHNSNVVQWDRTGKGFIVNNLHDFTNQILLKKFNISRLDSFARKLNKYGFKRSKIDKNRIRFFHANFNHEGSYIHRIQKLNKEDTLPKHIKLRLIRDQLNKETMSDQEIGGYLVKCEDSSEELVRRFEIVDGNFVLIPMGTPLDSITNPLGLLTIDEKIGLSEAYEIKNSEEDYKFLNAY